jgi:hypothetical protein
MKAWVAARMSGMSSFHRVGLRGRLTEVDCVG